MNPIIKWPGGKAQEFSLFKEDIPSFSRYVEPFFGGGAVFFNLQPKQSVINDKSKELIDLYKFIKDEKGYDRGAFEQELNKYVENWEKIEKYFGLMRDDLFGLYSDLKLDLLGKDEFEQKVEKYIKEHVKIFNGLFHKDFCVDRVNLRKQINKNIVSKLLRVKKLEKTKGDIGNEDLDKNIETAFRSGFYMHFRDLMNEKIGSEDIALAKKVANYYFIREFCYGAMFRFNKNGDFNIPYGGIAYNTKNIRAKVEHLLSDDVQGLFNATKIYNDDFEKVFDREKFDKEDFIFLDPPYDTDFNDYEGDVFGRDDQARLSDTLVSTKAKFMLVIKETEYIKSLYTNKKNINIKSFEKNYLYNVKGRNDREVNHLVITNY